MVNDYSLVYFHHGLTTANKPPLKWLVQAYRGFDRNFKKNLKALYIVHPTNFVQIIINVFKPIIRSASTFGLTGSQCWSNLSNFHPTFW